MLKWMLIIEVLIMLVCAALAVWAYAAGRTPDEKEAALLPFIIGVIVFILFFGTLIAKAIFG